MESTEVPDTSSADKSRLAVLLVMDSLLNG
jgi:hypothetical protein